MTIELLNSEVETLLSGRQTQLRIPVTFDFSVGSYWVKEPFSVIYGGKPPVDLPALAMPQSLSRATIRVTSSCIRALQDMTTNEAIANGIEPYKDYGMWKNYLFHTAHPHEGVTITDEAHRVLAYQNPVRSFRTYWDSIHGEGSWEKNEMVWVADIEIV
jgi:hypothetical protein